VNGEDIRYPDGNSDGDGAEHRYANALPGEPRAAGVPTPDTSGRDQLAWEAMEIAVELLNMGLVDRATQWFDNAASLGYPEAPALRDACQRLSNAAFDAEVASLATGGPDRDALDNVAKAKEELDTALDDAAREAAQRINAATKQRAAKNGDYAPKLTDIPKIAGDWPHTQQHPQPHPRDPS
jgi:hypothetical protein